jgi:Flp pilus assembly protein TadB
MTDTLLILVFALVGGMGAYIAFGGVNSLKPKPKRLLESQRILSGQEEKPFFLSIENLEVSLQQADLNVSALAFLRVGAIGALILAGGMFALTGAIAVAVVAFFGFFVVYWWWLVQQRDKKRMAYEDAIPDWVDRMAIASIEKDILKHILVKSADLAPPAVREDAKWLADEISFKNIGPTDALRALCKRKQSSILSLMTQVLVAWSDIGSSKPLAEVLAPLSESIRARTSARNAAEADLTMTRGQLALVTLAPVAFIIMLRGSDPNVARYYSTLEGQIVVVACCGVAAIGYIIGDRILSVVRKSIDIKVDIDQVLSGVTFKEAKKSTDELNKKSEG